MWITEHHFIPAVGVCPSSLTMAGFLLGHTQRLRVGTAVCILPLYHPVHLAEQAALLDHLSNGRFDFGIGKGGFPRDRAVFGRTREDLHPIMCEALDVMLRAWTHDRVAADGDFVRFPFVTVYPRPHTRPHPPVYVVCQSRPTVELAARHGLPMMLSFTIDDDAKAAQVTLYRELAARYGHDPTAIDHACAVVGYVGNSRREVEQVARPNIERFFEANHDAEHLPDESGAGPGEHSVPRSAVRAFVAERTVRMLSFNPVGTAEQCVERLQQIVERTGVRRFVVLCEFAVERAAVLETLERFACEIMPNVEPA